MSEKQEQIDTTEAPEWFPHKQEYWTCTGTMTAPSNTELANVRVCVFYSAEDAEADACTHHPFWKWDRTPAVKVMLSDMMRKARQRGLAGVDVRAWVDGKWQIVRKYPVDVPLPKEER